MSKNARRAFVGALAVADALAAFVVAAPGAMAAPGSYSQTDIDRAIDAIDRDRDGSAWSEIAAECEGDGLADHHHARADIADGARGRWRAATERIAILSWDC